MGGMVAQSRTRRARAVLTLTLGATYCGGRPRSSRGPSRQRRRDGDPLRRQERKIRTGWAFNVSPAFASAEANFERFTQVAVAYPVPLEMVMAQVQAIIAHDTSARLGEIAAPTLVVHGTVDQMLVSANGELVASLIPGARLELLDGVGHLFFWEQPERVAQLVAEHAAAARAA